MHTANAVMTATPATINPLNKDFWSRARLSQMMTYCFLFVVAAFVFSPEANATTATGAAFLKDTVTWFVNFMKGYGGILAAMLGLVWTLYEAFIQKSLQGVAIAIGVSIIAVYGPTAIQAFFGATL